MLISLLFRSLMLSSVIALAAAARSTAVNAENSAPVFARGIGGDHARMVADSCADDRLQEPAACIKEIGCSCAACCGSL